MDTYGQISLSSFPRPQKALDHIMSDGTDIALIDMDTPGIKGIGLAEKIKKTRPKVTVILLASSESYAIEAFRVHVSGYLLKPLSPERLAAELEYFIAEKCPDTSPLVTVRTFDGFDVFVNRSVITFPRSKAKELLAYLVDRQGASASRKVIAGALWEDDNYSRSRQKYLDSIIRSLRNTLSEYGIDSILEMDKGALRICPEKIDCDAYRFFNGDAEAIQTYRGKYMSEYPWASTSESYMDRLKNQSL